MTWRRQRASQTGEDDMVLRNLVRKDTRSRLADLGDGPPWSVAAIRLVMLLEQIYRWGFTTAALAGYLLRDTSRHRYEWLIRWERQGLIRGVDPDFAGVPRLYIITRAGVQWLQMYSDYVLDRPLLDCTKISRSTLNHRLATQRAVTILLGKYGKHCAYATDREIAYFRMKGCKYPDAAILDERGELAAIELEIAAKSLKNLQRGLDAVCRDLAKKNVNRYLYLVSSSALGKRLDDVLARGWRTFLWVNGKWTQPRDSELYVPPKEIVESVLTITIESIISGKTPGIG